MEEMSKFAGYMASRCVAIALVPALAFGIIAYDLAGDHVLRDTKVTYSESYKGATACRRSLFSKICYSKSHDKEVDENKPELDCRMNTVSYLTFTHRLYWDKDCDDTLDFVDRWNSLFGTREEEKFSPPKRKIEIYHEHPEFFLEDKLKRKAECMFDDPEFFEKFKSLSD